MKSTASKITLTVCASLVFTLALTWIIDTEATCTTAGAQHKECTVCHNVSERAYIDMVDHTMTEWIDEIPATTTATATKGYQDCSVRGKHFDDKGNERLDPAESMLASQYTVTVEGGRIEGVDQTSVEVSAGGEITVIAANVSGKVFMGWSIDGGKTILSKQQRYTFAATQNVDLVAVYQPMDVQPTVESADANVNTLILVGCLSGMFVVVYIVGAVLYRNNQIDGRIYDILYFYLRSRKQD